MVRGTALTVAGREHGWIRCGAAATHDAVTLKLAGSKSPIVVVVLGTRAPCANRVGTDVRSRQGDTAFHC